ncbi:hypothetical protein D9615_006584 [Tricholomella constricta]|uniref:Uncharacterized protein n=1 Tax=Tricholomella constricta TaxID=117010 RepID=A0A8H5H9V1_9AGAR|nr:hypothetical protein D9615_006584 [Tricholomella constricta]
MAPSAQAMELIAVMCESILIGAYAVLTALVIWLLVTKRRKMPRMHKVLFGASIVMFLISVAHLALVMQQNTSLKLSKQNAQARIILSGFQLVIGDLVLIWRVWIVWGRNYWIVAPSFTMTIVAACLLFNLASLKEFRKFFTVAPAALFVANTSMCTLLIAGKIWYARYQLHSLVGGTMYASGGFSGTVALFIETGALSATCQILSLILDHIHSDGIHILLDLEIPLIGILPTLIIVFVHFELVGTNSVNTSTPSRSIHFEDRNRVHLDTFSLPGTDTTATEGMNRDAKVYDYTRRGTSMA